MIHVVCIQPKMWNVIFYNLNQTLESVVEVRSQLRKWTVFGPIASKLGHHEAIPIFVLIFWYHDLGKTIIVYFKTNMISELQNEFEFE